MVNLAPSLAGDLSPSLRRQGLWVLLANYFLMWTGFVMVVPLIAVHYVDRLGWAAAAIGLILAIRQFTQQGLGVFTGMWADRVGVKWLICGGVLLRALGFGLMAWAGSFPLLLLSALLAALGGAFFESPGRAAAAALAEPEERPRYFALQGAAGSIGTALGPLAGTFLLRFSFQWVALASASFYVIAFFLVAIWLPSPKVVRRDDKLAAGVQAALRDRVFVIFTALGAGLWFMWVQFSVAIPLRATAISGTADVVGWIYMLNAAMSIALQVPLVSLLSRWVAPIPMLALGQLIMAVGLGGVALAGNTTMLLGCMTLYIIGQLLGMPSQQTATADLSDPTKMGSYFGVGMLALAVGGGLGNYAGGALYDLGQSLDWPALPWLVFCVVGLITGSGLLWLERARRAPVTVPAPTQAS